MFGLWGGIEGGDRGEGSAVLAGLVEGEGGLDEGEGGTTLERSLCR